MPEANCSLATCGTSRRTKGIGIFKLPAPVDDFHADWRAKITKDRVTDASFRDQIKKDRVHICEKHFEKDEIETGKNEFNCICLHARSIVRQKRTPKGKRPRSCFLGDLI